jgi:hypothetical protein
MTMKKTDLARSLNAKIEGRMKTAGVPARFGPAAAVPDRREQRRLDAAAGLVPFACKLPSDLVRQIGEAGASHPEGINGWLAQVLSQAVKA